MEMNTETLESIEIEIITKIKSNTIDREFDDHVLAPHILKSEWKKLGVLVQNRENLNVQNCQGNQYMTLRMDGGGFSKLVKKYKQLQIFEETFSKTLAEIMQECARYIMKRWNALYGFTQSDEITIIIPATLIDKSGKHYPHTNNGRKQKICSSVASQLSTKFLLLCLEKCKEKGIEFPADSERMIPYFDCRMGIFESELESISLLLWRAHDCSINGVSDAVHQRKAGKVIKGLNTIKKLEWLQEQGLLPLNPHQAYGSFYVKTKRMGMGYNPKTDTSVQTMRSFIDHVPGNLLDLIRKEKLFTQLFSHLT